MNCINKVINENLSCKHMFTNEKTKLISCKPSISLLSKDKKNSFGIYLLNYIKKKHTKKPPTKIFLPKNHSLISYETITLILTPLPKGMFTFFYMFKIST